MDKGSFITVPQTSVCQLRNSQRRPLFITEVVDRLSCARAEDNSVTVGDLEGEVIFRLRVSCLGHGGPDLPASASRPSSTGQAGFAMLASGRQYWEMTIGNGGGVHEAASEEDGEEDDGIRKKGTTSGLCLGLESCMEYFFLSEGE